MKLHEAKQIADGLIEDLTPFSEKISIAGSIRRERPEVNDIEIVMVRKKSELIYLMDYLKYYKKIKGNVTGKYMQLEMPDGIKIDLFFCDEDQWGNIYFIRTGSYDWNIQIMGELRKNGYRHEEGRLHKDGVVIPCYEEEDLFKAIGINFVDPPNRHLEYLRENNLF